MNSRRIEHWPTKLYTFIEHRRKTPFKWGFQDCVLFACDGIKVITRIDPVRIQYRGKYHSALEAGRLLQKDGGLEAICATRCDALGFVEESVMMAHRGNLMLADIDKDHHLVCESNGEPVGCALGICLGEETAFAGPDGLVFVSTLGCRRAWRIY